MNTAEAVAKVIEDLRKQADCSQVHLSEATGIPRTTLQRRLDGDPLKVNELDAITKALGIDAASVWSQAALLTTS